MSELFDHINMINMKTKHLDTSLDTVKYEPYLINKSFSNIKETVLLANEINTDCDKQLNFDFYYYLLPKSKRFGKWPKKAAVNNKKIIDDIIQFYNCSRQKAEEMYVVMADCNLINNFQELTALGGKNKR